ncbi:ABA4-like family protein [Sphingomonas sp. NSE70-1]|uniref:ABA4-like family protein n=1 Tax=Sphingomonas caseinilyticus TaxID=2908205 RepID=A0ABT0RT45_9SPHN|nr:ABA4-like family protein [Sphingomonas caseinilyticus]MCL6697875.1 ABA4-like family protein [Sphingomonas caseinilyticus]
MPWGGLFTFVHVVALAGWALLFLAPRGPRVAAYVLYLCVGLLCLTYTVMFASQFGSIVAGDFLSVEGIRALFASDGGIVIGWTHYLAFDLFIGQWIAKDADHKGFSRVAQAPILLLTLLAGPIGLLIWLVVRERRARASVRG